LQLSLKFAGLNVKNYKSHSFRIGAATTAWAKGFSEEQIQQMGRWNSEAFKKYIRIPLFKKYVHRKFFLLHNKINKRH
jgi:hypothetical protein